jgi:hypothetical protein
MSRNHLHIKRAHISVSYALGLISEQKYSLKVLLSGYRFPSEYLQWINNHHYITATRITVINSKLPNCGKFRRIK